MFRFLIKRWCYLLVLVLALPGVGWVYMQARHARDQVNPANARKKGQPIPVRTEQASEKEMDIVIGGTCLSIPYETIGIRVGNAVHKPNEPIGDMILKSKLVEDGKLVAKGQVLFEIEDEVFRNITKERELALDAARAELEKVKLAVAHNQKLRELSLASALEGKNFRKEEAETRKEASVMAETLYKKGAMGIIEWFEARIKFAQAKFDVSEAERALQRAQININVGPLTDKAELAKIMAQVNTAQVDLEVAQAKVKRCQVKSPVDGFVNQVTVVPGQILEDNTLLANVYRLDPILVRMDFPQERLDDVALGMKAEIVLDSFPKETFEGKVIRILPQANPTLRVLPVILEVSNANFRIKAGVSGFVRIRQNRKALTVPAQAVLQHGSKAMVFRVEDGRARIREVTTGPILETGMLEIRKGLAAGDEIVIYENIYLNMDALAKKEAYLKDNDPVNPNWRKWARRD